MSRWLETSIAAARARTVPWNAERGAAVERSIAARRTRAVVAAPLARLTLGGLASAALLASVAHVSQLIRERGRLPDQDLGQAMPLLQGPAPELEPSSLERPVGDGGFD